MPNEVISVIGTGPGADYSSVSAWEADTDNDLVSADEYHEGRLQGQDHANTSLFMSGATEDATRFRRLTVVNGARHHGLPVEASGANTARLIGAATGYTIFTTDQHCDFDSFEIAFGGGQDAGLQAIRIVTQSSGAEHHIHDLIVHNSNGVAGQSTSNYGLAMLDNDAVIHVYRNIVFGFWYSGIWCFGAPGSICHHNTVFKCNRAESSSRGGIEFDVADYTASNNLVFDCGGFDYQGLSSATHSKNASSDTTGDTGYQNRVLATDSQYDDDSVLPPVNEVGCAQFDSPNYSYSKQGEEGDTPSFYENIPAGRQRRPVIWFQDIDGIPAGALLLSGTLTITCTGDTLDLQVNYLNELEPTDSAQDIYDQAEDNAGTYYAVVGTFTGNGGTQTKDLSAVALASLKDASGTGNIWGVGLYASGGAGQDVELADFVLQVTYWANGKFGRLFLDGVTTLRDAGELLGPPYNVGIRGNLADLPDIGADELSYDGRRFRVGPRPHHRRPGLYRPDWYRPTMG